MSERDDILNELFGHSNIEKNSSEKVYTLDEILKEFSKDKKDNAEKEADVKEEKAPEVQKAPEAPEVQKAPEAPEVQKAPEVKEPLKIEIDQSLFGKEQEKYVNMFEDLETDHKEDKPAMTMSEKFKTMLFSTEEEEEDNEPEAFEEKEEVRETTSLQSFSDDMKIKSFSYLFKSIVSLLAAFILLYLSVAKDYGIYLPKAFSATGSAFGYSFANLIILGIVLALSTKFIADGILCAIKLKFSSDSLISIAFVFVFIFNFCCAFSVIKTNELSEGIWQMYNSALAFVMAFNYAGKWLFLKNVYRNTGILKSENLSTIDFTDIKEEKVCGVKKITEIKDPDEKSFPEDICEKSNKITAPIVILCAIAAFALSLIFKKGFVFSFVSFTAVLMMGSSFTSELAYSLPIYLSSNKSRKSGGAFLGFDSIDKYSDVNTIVIKDKDLFDPKDVFISGMKIFDKSKIKDIIIDAVSLYNAQNGPLSEAFKKILDNKDEMLKQATDIQCEFSKGFSAVIDGQRFYAGKREFLMQNKIKFAKESFQTSFTTNEKHVVYFANEYELLAVFVVSYGSEFEVAPLLDKFDYEEDTIVILTYDYNITKEFMYERFGFENVNIVVPSSEKERKKYKKAIEDETVSDSHIASQRGFVGAVSAVVSCAVFSDTVRKTNVLRNAGIILGAVIMLLIAVLSSVPVTADKVIIYQLLWALPVFALPVLKS